MKKEPPSICGPLPVVTVENRQDLDVGDFSAWAELAARALAHEGVPARSEVGLAFVSADEMTDLNVTHMHGDGPTDVLAFPIDGWSPDFGVTAPAIVSDANPPAMLGDIIVCPVVAQKATSSSQSLPDELALLVVHGALHLIGHDHYDPDEREQMQARERDLLARFHPVAQTVR